MKDKYDKAIEYLTEHPEEIKEAWFDGNSRSRHRNLGACLFAYATKNGFSGKRRDGRFCDCLTGIRLGGVAQRKRMTEGIRADERLPNCVDDITLSDLPVFAQWQRRIDKELNR